MQATVVEERAVVMEEVATLVVAALEGEALLQEEVSAEEVAKVVAQQVAMAG